MLTSVNFDEELVGRLRQGDSAAFVDIYEKYWYKVFLSAYRRVGDKEVARELTQNLFLKIWDRRLKMQIDKLENYLMISIKNAVIGYIENQLASNRYLKYYQSFISLQNLSTENTVSFNDLSEAIERGLIELPEKSRTVFKLHKLDHWSVEKVAHHLQLSEKTVGYHLTKSLKFMRIFLKEFTLSVFLLLSGF